jgi:transposase InsO family protein
VGSATISATSGGIKPRRQPPSSCGSERYSQRIIGWSLGATRDARLILAALNRAVRNRRPRPGLIFHSDRGIEYAAYAFRARLAALGFVQSMNRPREITDNAQMESSFHSMKSDTIAGFTFTSAEELGQLLRSYVLQSPVASFGNRLSFHPLRVADTMTAARCLQNRGKDSHRLARR